LLAAAIAAFLLVTACSSDEPDTATGEETPDTTAAQSEAADADADAAEREVSEAPETPSPENEPSERAGGAGDVAGIDPNEDYCELVVQAEESGLFSGAGPQTPDDLTPAAERTRQLTRAMVRQAPDEIADDVETASRPLADLLSVLEAHASRTGEVGPDAREDNKVQAAIDAIESKEVQEANDRVAEWQREHC
jgi:hypothetical protein